MHSYIRGLDELGASMETYLATCLCRDLDSALSVVGRDGFVVGGAGGAVGFGVHDRGGETWDGVDQAMFGVVGDRVRLYHGCGVIGGDFTLGA